MGELWTFIWPAVAKIQLRSRSPHQRMTTFSYRFTGAHPHCRPKDAPLLLKSHDGGTIDGFQAPKSWTAIRDDASLVESLVASTSTSWIVTDALKESSFRRFPTILPSLAGVNAEGGALVAKNPRILRGVCAGLHNVTDKHALGLLTNELKLQYGVPSVVVDELGNVKRRPDSDASNFGDGIRWITKAASSHRGHGLYAHLSLDAAIDWILETRRLQLAAAPPESLVKPKRKLTDRFTIQPLLEYPVLRDGKYKLDLRIWAGFLFGTQSSNETEDMTTKVTDLINEKVDIEFGGEKANESGNWFELWIHSHGLARITGHVHPSCLETPTEEQVLRGEVTNYALQKTWLAQHTPEGSTIPRVEPFTPDSHPKELPHTEVFAKIADATKDLFDKLVRGDKLNRFGVTGATLLGLDFLVCQPPGLPCRVYLLEANLLPSTWRHVEPAQTVADTVLCYKGWGKLVERAGCRTDGMVELPEPTGKGWTCLGRW